MSNTNKILVITSSASSITLKDGREEHVGYYVNELTVPIQGALDAGYQMVLATPNGTKPIIDPQSAVAAHFGGSEVALRKALNFVDTEEAKRLAEGWQYAGYRMTIFSNDEEHYAEEHYMGGSKIPFYVNDALKIAGGSVSISDKGIFHPFLVEDRELITGQNPPSDHEMRDRFVNARIARLPRPRRRVDAYERTQH